MDVAVGLYVAGNITWYLVQHIRTRKTRLIRKLLFLANLLMILIGWVSILAGWAPTLAGLTP